MKRHSAQKTDARYAIGLTTGFLILGGFTAFNHEMWRDEIQAWLLARDSASFFELFAHLKYEGHPGLWHLCLMPLSRITASPVIMQVFHLLIAGVTVYLFVRYAPFNWLQKFLFCFGYFVLYEYAVIARNYALGLLLLILFCVLFRERYKRPLWIGGILFLLAHTSVHALIVTIAISFALFCEYFLMKIARLKTAPTAEHHPDPVGALCKRALESARLETAPTAEHHPDPVGALFKRAGESARLKTAPTAEHRLGPVGALFKRALESARLETAPTAEHRLGPVGALFKRALASARLKTAPTAASGRVTVGALCKRALASARLETAPTDGNRRVTVGALCKRAPKHTPFQTAPTNNTLVWLSFALICIGILTSVLQLKPPVDTGFAVGWKFDYETSHLFKVIELISRAYLPIPKPTLHFWNSHQLETYPLFQTLQIPLCFLLMFCGVVLTYKRPTALLIYLTSTLGLLAFFYVKYYGSIRHHGFLFLTFVMVAWIYRESARLETTPTANGECSEIGTHARLETAPTAECRRGTVGALCKRALASARLETAPTAECRRGTVGALCKRALASARLETAPTAEHHPGFVGALCKRALASARLETAPTAEHHPGPVGALFKRALASARLETAPTAESRRGPVGALCKRALASARLETAPTEREGTRRERAFSILLTLILACHFIGGVTAVFMENRHIFSCGKQTAEYIKARGMREMPMVGDTDFAVSTVVGYLEKEAIYYPRGSRFGSFIRWDDARTAEVPTADVLEAARTLSVETSQAVLLILNRAVNARLQEQYRLIDVARFTGSIVGDEEFFIYRMPAP